MIEGTKGSKCKVRSCAVRIIITRKTSDIVSSIASIDKDIDQVMANQSDLVEVLHTLKLVVCVKARATSARGFFDREGWSLNDGRASDDQSED
ncbi:RNA-splicing ligase RtcB [Thiorhodovibrio winogradskyi]|uniref:RNA-splicing ligase RtcB n=2 Tax=Thiorhodovibrio winogradskyi TaxID=77007 RepID=A0ABZ0S7N8_9GAMM